MSERIAAIKAALAGLKTETDDDWTAAGLPSMDRVKAISGLEDLTRQEVAEAVPGYTRDTAKAAPSDLSNVGSPETVTPDTSTPADAEPRDEPEVQIPTPDVIAKHLPNPILLIEAANIAMNADDRYRKNGELQTFMRHYLIAQVNIKAHQDRLDKRYADAQRAAG